METQLQSIFEDVVVGRMVLFYCVIIKLTWSSAQNELPQRYDGPICNLPQINRGQTK